MSGLDGYSIIGFVTIFNVERAKSFYRDTLGLRLVSEESPFAVVFDAHGTMLRLAISPQAVKPGQGTVLGWQVSDIEAVVRELAGRGVVFEHYAFLKPDELGIWTAPTGAKIAWFKDPDGNVLSVSEHPEAG
jgi:catechol 2,3-dioxygenase-like lactoylglutathione lyase family enzyme